MSLDTSVIGVKLRANSVQLLVGMSVGWKEVNRLSSPTDIPGNKVKLKLFQRTVKLVTLLVLSSYCSSFFDV